jgi:hypothetical protein
MRPERFTYPSYEAPLLSAYDCRFECAYAVLHPFLQIPESVAEFVVHYPTNEQIVTGGQKYRWSRVANQANLKSYSEVNHGLLSAILALKPEFQNAVALEALKKFLDRTRNVSIPSEGGFPILLRQDIVFAFQAANAEELIFVPEFPDMDPIQHLRVADVSMTYGQSIPARGTLLAPDESFLLTVDWDSFFTLFYGPRSFVHEVVEHRELEGFFVAASNHHGWYSEAVPLP